MARLVGTMLTEAAAARGEHPAVWQAGHTVGYAEIEAAANRLAHGLAARGFGVGDRIALYAINSPEFVIAYFAIMKAGATVVPVNLLLHPDTVAYILDDSGARGILVHAAVAGQLAPIRDRLAALDLAATTAPTDVLEDAPTLADLSDAQPSEAPAEPDIDPADHPAAILYTSGTTGRPKGAQLTHQNLLANVEGCARVIVFEPDDRVITVLPMFHAFAAMACVLLTIRSGATIAAIPRFLPDEIARAIGADMGTVFMGVPSMYAVLANLPEGRGIDFSPVRMCICGGAPMPVEILRRFEERYGCEIIEGDGPTECSPVTSVNPLDGRRKIGTIGLPLHNVEMRIVDDEGNDLPAGEIGEIVVRGDNVMKGYWNRPEETAAAFFGGWFRTGDLGNVDDDGFFTIVDRKKDLIIVNGMNVYPRMIEEAIYQHPAVAECAVVPDPHRLHGEIPRAVIVLVEGATATKDDIRSWCRKRLGRHEVPRIVEFTDALPKSGAGKILKRELIRRP